MNRALLCLAASCFAAATAASQNVDPAEWAPRDALVFVGVTDSAELWERVKKTSIYNVMSDKDAGKSMAPVTQLTEKFMQKLAAAINLTPEQVQNPFGGPAAISLAIPSGKKLDDAAPLAVLGVKRRDLMAQYYESAVKKLGDAAAEHKKENVGSWQIDTFVGRPKDEQAAQHDDDVDPFGLDETAIAAWAEKVTGELFSPDALPDNLALCLADDRLIVAHDADAVREALRRSGPRESLAGDDDYRSLPRHFPKLGPVRFFVNVPRFVELGAAESPDSAKTLDALGLRSFGALLAHLSVGTDEHDFLGESLLLTRGERSGLARILTMDNRPVAPADVVPESASIYVSLNLSFAALFDEIEKILRQTDPAAADEMRTGMENTPTPSGETMNMRKDVIDNLRAPLDFYLAFGKPYGVETSRLMVSIGHRNRDAIEKVLGMIPPPFLAPREVRGARIFDAPMGGVSVAASSDTVFLGNTAGVESALNSSRADGSLAASATFRKVAQHAPREAWLTFYADNRQFMEAIFGLLEKSEEISSSGATNPAAMIGLQIALSTAGGEEKPDVEALRRLLKYYGTSILTLTTTPDGIRGMTIQLKPGT
ncbi:MAG: hypothetical protein CHACPFDD_00437 [Phycisphaerae bacterium]|nr:hypothetical protein [Phycisphaerae bacterium]